jgi:4-hydroxyphenylpyruvate dioxygenase
MRVAFEALAWGSKIWLFSQANAVVERVNHLHLGLGLGLDSFHTLALRDEDRPDACAAGWRSQWGRL